MRINKYLAKCGIGSRRKCDEYISSGKIKVDGKKVTDFSFNVNDDSYVQFNNKLVNKLENVIYMLNKPRGYICTKNDKRIVIIHVKASPLKPYYYNNKCYVLNPERSSLSILEKDVLQDDRTYSFNRVPVSREGG